VAYAIVRNDLNQILLVRRADDLYWELPGGRVEIGESGERVYRQFAVCFHALTTIHNAQPDQDEAIAATWFDPERATQLVMHRAGHTSTKHHCHEVRRREFNGDVSDHEQVFIV
jgi:8-oxo-dGTP pyrophosphatase MutT (NUDIX family)